MERSNVPRFASAFLLLTLAACTQPPAVEDTGSAVQDLGDYTVHFGVVPAARAPTALAPHAVQDRDAHGLRRPGSANAHHLVLVVMRDRDGQPMQDVQARASVELPDRVETRVLDPMPVNGAMSYGGVFVLPGPGRYAFQARMQIPGRAEPLQATFVYTLAHEAGR